MKIIHALFVFVIISVSISCKKNAVNLSGDNKLIDFKINGQLVGSTVDQNTQTINIIVPYQSGKTKLEYSFSVSKDAIVTINYVPQQGSSAAADFSKPVTMTILAPNGEAKNWTITVKTDIEAYGLGSNVTASKSIAANYEWYMDQAGTGQFASTNCGPAVATMAIKWADQSFSNTIQDARNTYLSSGGWWYTTDIVNYLNKYGISSSYTSLPDQYETIKKYIDKDYLVILCLDNYYITYNVDHVQHIDKYYKVNAKGSGHFIIVKGYKQVDHKFYFEVYDPWSFGSMYIFTNQLRGQDRYYRSEDLETATGIWWDYGIAVALKGKKVTFSTTEVNSTSVQSSMIPAQKGY